jgi:NADH:ubiquinone oxidoreductase subunit F (NADH-binding)
VTASSDPRRAGPPPGVGHVRRVDSGGTAGGARHPASASATATGSGALGGTRPVRAVRGPDRRPGAGAAEGRGGAATAVAPKEPPAPDRVPRLLAGITATAGPIDIDRHLAQWGPLDLRRARIDLIDELEASGLRGHGGAWFPVAAKWRSVATRGRRPVVVANGTEGEPASAKDGFLLEWAPNLVIDGASAAAAALRAERVILNVPRRLVATVSAEVAGRERHRMDPVPIEVVPAVAAFVAGQESAVVNALEGRAPVPSFVTLRPVRERGVGGRPTLVQNVETLAHVSLIARYGARWFRGLGTERDPGTMLLTLHDGGGAPQVFEMPLGVPMRHALHLSPTATTDYQAALVGGYGSGWVSMGTLLGLELSETDARRHGVGLGPGVIALLPRGACPVAETARVVRYMEGQSAGQCGPCVLGLAALADSLESLAFDHRPAKGLLDRVSQLCELVEGRGACRHPDGVARFVRSALDVFDDDMANHLHGWPCERAGARPLLPVPGVGGVRQSSGRLAGPTRQAVRR